ncbi:DUF4352 domain-containing protein [Streptomyces lavendulae]|uniref:DUF4352 domain-containing protein n=1 Tax=Streptomyces lavendulae TaxID=1914 RepID=UPI0036AA9C3B
MSTPPNPPDSPTTPEATPIPRPGPSLTKPPTPPAPADETPAPETPRAEPPTAEAPPATADTPEAHPTEPPAAPEAPKPSLEKAPATPETPSPSPAAPEAPKPSSEQAPAASETPKPSLQKAPPAPEATKPSPEDTPAAPEAPKPSLDKAPPAPEAAWPSPEQAPAAPGVPAAAAQGFGYAAPPAGAAVAGDPWATPAPGAPGPAPAPAGFAPVGPVPAAPGAGAYGAPAANTWAPPPGYGAPGHGGPGGPGFPGYGHPGPGFPAPGYPLAPPAPSNGQAVAGLVLSALAIGLGLVPFVFWVGGGLALTGIGLSIAGLVRAGRGAPRKVMSLVGIALGVLGLAATVGGFLFTMAVVDEFPDRVDQHQGSDWYDDPEYDDPDHLPSPSGFALPPDMPSTGPGISTPVAFGQTVTYPNGIQVTLSAPKRYTTSNKYLPVGNAVEVTFTITNTSKRPHDVVYAMPNLTDDKGAEGKLVFDGRMPKRIQGTIQPGESATGTAAFEVPEGTRSVSAELSPGLLMPDAKFTGPVG